MRLVIQRVSRASVRVADRTVGAIGRGVLVLVGVQNGDDDSDVVRAAGKVATMRLFEDAAGKMNLDLAAVEGAVLAVSQFTLAASLDRGRRPSFEGAMEPAGARRTYDAFVERLRDDGLVVETGSFGAHMAVELVNDGPVTFLYSSRREGAERGE